MYTFWCCDIQIATITPYLSDEGSDPQVKQKAQEIEKLLRVAIGTYFGLTDDGVCFSRKRRTSIKRFNLFRKKWVSDPGTVTIGCGAKFPFFWCHLCVRNSHLDSNRTTIDFSQYSLKVCSKLGVLQTITNSTAHM